MLREVKLDLLGGTRVDKCVLFLNILVWQKGRHFISFSRDVSEQLFRNVLRVGL